MSRFNPRLITSTKWTEIPEEFLAKVLTVFNNQFKKEVETGEFLAEGHIYPQELVLRVGYLEAGRLKQINFEASIDLKPVAEKPAGSSMQGPATISDIPTFPGAGVDDAFGDEGGVFADSQAEALSDPTGTMASLYTCIDVLGSLMEEYFQKGDVGEVDVTLHWKAYDFEDDVVYLQYSTVNTRLEEEADRILGLLGEDLVFEGDPSEDALANADVDSELAAEVQRMIREGKYRPNHPGVDQDFDSDSESEKN